MNPSSGFLIQAMTHISGGHAPFGDFELIAASPRGGFVHRTRRNQAADLPWVTSAFFGSGFFDGGSLIQRSAGHMGGDLEALARVGDRLAHFRREEGKWKEPLYIGSGIVGRPAMIQSRFGRMGNYEVVVPVSGGLAFYRRQNDDPSMPWSSPVFFGAGIGEIEGVALIESRFGDPGNLEIVVTVRNGSTRSLAHFWCDPASSSQWNGPIDVPLTGLAADAQPTGIPSMVHGRHGNLGDFELVVPLTGGGMAHLARRNDDPELRWSAARQFGGSDPIAEAGLIDSDFGNLEVVARAGDRYLHYWFHRDSETWIGPVAAAWEEPPLDLPTQGEWRIPYSCSIVGIHSILLPTGKVLLFTYLTAADQGRGLTSVIDPDTGQETALPVLEKDPFCGGHASLADGRVLVAGGSGGGLAGLQIFEPSGDAGAWQQLPDMPQARWYPTCTALPDGRVLIVSGTVEGGTQPDVPLNATYQIFSASGGLGEPVPLPYLNEISPVSIYPFVFVLPSGKVLIHGGNKTCFLDLGTGQAGDTRFSTNRTEPRTYPVQGSAVLLPLLPDAVPPYRAKILLIGGGGVPPSTDAAATDTCELLDVEDAPLRWQAAAQMAHPRVMPDAVLLPDGTVLVVNGSRAGWSHDANQPVYEAEIFDPATGAWSQVCARRVPRLYHSSAVLLPDGRVLTAGSDETYNIEPFHRHELRIEIFSPPYLFRGPRPQFAGGSGAVPEEIGYGAAFEVETPDAAAVRSAALLRPGAATHSMNMEQRFVGLRIASRSAGALELEAPPGGAIAPPGYYMLFLISDAGVPSVARIVRLS
jgi:hypothetical protein